MQDSQSTQSATWTCAAWQEAYLEMVRSLERGDEPDPASLTLTFEQKTEGPPPNTTHGEPVAAVASTGS